MDGVLITQNSKELLTKEHVQTMCEKIANDLRTKIPNTPVNLILEYHEKYITDEGSFDGELEVGDIDTIHVRFKPHYIRSNGKGAMWRELSKISIRRWSQDYNNQDGTINTSVMQQEAKIMLDLANNIDAVKTAMCDVYSIIYHFNHDLVYEG